MRRDLFDYDLPTELIASRPPEARDGGRMLVVREGSATEHARITDLPEALPEGALVVVNDTRVVPARLLGWKAGSGGQVELLLLEKLGDGSPAEGERWRALGRSSKPLRAGTIIDFDRENKLSAEIVRHEGEGGSFEVRLFSRAGSPIEEAIDALGHVPLPPYIRRPDDDADRARYQTTFARVRGAAAAPTAGLHLSEPLLARLAARGVEIAPITLHVGLGTFQPVKVDDLDDHPMHEEVFCVGEDATLAIERARARGAPVVAIGTTVVRALESAADPERLGFVRPMAGRTRLLIQPGYRFRVVDALLTNFHLPQSTLLAMVCAFAGRDQVLSAYEEAVRERYRFFSYGDAMLLAQRAQEAL